MNNKNYNLLNVGVGGQGVIRTVQIIAWAALKSNYEVRATETHGMAQRGGSVTSFIRFGTKVEGPLIPKGHADVILAFEASEALRNSEYAGPNTLFLINEQILIPPTVNKMGNNYPTIKEIEGFLKDQFNYVCIFDARELALKAGSSQSLNIVMLGVLSGLENIPINQEILESTLLEFVPTKAQDVNKKAFKFGIEKGKLMKRYVL